MLSRCLLSGLMGFSVASAIFVYVRRTDNIFNFDVLYIGLCSFFCPCIQFGRNAEAIGENCVTYGLSQLVPIFNVYCKVVVRGRIRDQKRIDGTCINDLLCSLFCYECTIAQEAQVKRRQYNMVKIIPIL